MHKRKHIYLIDYKANESKISVWKPDKTTEGPEYDVKNRPKYDSSLCQKNLS